jgi:hypothetical protein
MYEVTNGEESVKMSGSKLQELLASNNKKVSKSLDDDRGSIDIDKDKLALEELGLTELKDVKFKGKVGENTYIFKYDGQTIEANNL